jgi:hypothetical protein
MFNAEDFHILVTILIRDLSRNPEKYRFRLLSGFRIFFSRRRSVHQPVMGEKLLCAVAPIFFTHSIYVQ